MADRDDEGYLLQNFYKTCRRSSYIVLQIIQREGATSFGKGNFQSFVWIYRNRAGEKSTYNLTWYEQSDCPVAHRESKNSDEFIHCSNYVRWKIVPFFSIVVQHVWT